MPFMAGTIIVMGLFFFVASLWQLHVFGVETQGAKLNVASVTDKWKPEDPMHKILVELEAFVVTRRYEQVRALMLLRAWTRYVGFLTGMILALVGSVFVLGKIGTGDESMVSSTELSGEGAGVKGSLKTPYPGVVLAALGSVLMGITIVAPFEFETRDVPVYLRASQRLEPQMLDAPEPWPSEEKSGRKSPNSLSNAEEESLFKVPAQTEKQ